MFTLVYRYGNYINLDSYAFWMSKSISFEKYFITFCVLLFVVYTVDYQILIFNEYPESFGRWTSWLKSITIHVQPIKYQKLDGDVQFNDQLP